MSDTNQVSTNPLLRGAFFDGSNLYVWSVPTLAAINGYQLSLRSSTGSQPQTGSNPDPTSGWSVLAQAQFFTNATMQLTLSLGSGTQSPYGPISAQPVSFPINAQGIAVTRAVRFADGSYYASWPTPVLQPPSNPPDPNALSLTRLLLRDAGSGLTEASAPTPLPTTSGTLASALPAVIGNRLELRLLALNANLAGVASTPLKVVGAPATAVRVANNGATIEVWWRPSLDPSVSGYQPWLYSVEDGWAAGTGGTADGAGHGTITPPTLDPAKHWYVTVIASATQAVAAVSVPVALPLQAYSLSAVWAAPALLQAHVAANASSGPAGPAQLVRALAGASELARVLVDGAPAQLPVDPAAVSALAWRSADGGQLGPEQQLSLALAAPTGLGISTDAVSGQSTLSWTAAGGVNYQIEWAPGIAPVNAGAVSSYPIPGNLGGVQALSARIRSNMQSGNTSILGLYSTPIGPLPAAPVDLQAEYDGLVIRAEWTPLAGVDGYVLTAWNGQGAVLSQKLPAASGSVELTRSAGSASDPWQLVIQSARGNVVGAPCDALSLIEAGWYVRAAASGAAPGTAALAPVLSPQTLTQYSQAQPYALSWNLPDLGINLSKLNPNPAFTLVAGSGAWPYQLQIQANSALWTFDGTALRASLVGNLQDFLVNLEDAGASAWGLDLIQRVIARGAPLTFQETLYVEYGLTGPNARQGYGSFDLRPGMVLRVQAPDYLNLDPNQSGALLNGFAPGASFDFPVGVDRSSGWRPTLDTAFAQLLALGAINVSPPPINDDGSAQGGAAAAADLGYTQMLQSYLRVQVPATLLSATSGGSAQAVDQYLITAAASYAELIAIQSPPSTAYSYFRGRAVLQPCVQIEVNGAPQTVALGTTVADVLRTQGALPAVAGTALSGLSVLRRIGPRQGEDSAVDAAAMQPVLVGWNGLANWGDGASALDLPVLAGDAIWFS